MKLMWNGIEFGQSYLKPEHRGKGFEPYYIYWFDWSEQENRRWGRHYFWYDGPHKWWCFWYFSIGWSTPWTRWNDEWER
jgi:hypothetical protein